MPGQRQSRRARGIRTGQPRLRLSRFFVGCVVIPVVMVAVAACGGSTKTVTVTTSTVPAVQSPLEQQYVSVIARVAPEVVQISTPQGLGSGVVFDKHGDVVTDAHVVAGGGAL